jgi:hypothetical protein
VSFEIEGVVLVREFDPVPLLVTFPVFIDKQRMGTIRHGHSERYELDPVSTRCS